MKKIIYLLLFMASMHASYSQNFPSSDPDNIFYEYKNIENNTFIKKDTTEIKNIMPNISRKQLDSIVTTLNREIKLNEGYKDNLTATYWINPNYLKPTVYLHGDKDYIEKDFVKIISGGTDNGIYNRFVSIDPTKGELEANMSFKLKTCGKKNPQKFIGFIRFNAKGAIADNTIDFFKEGSLVGNVNLKVGADFLLRTSGIINADENGASRIEVIKSNNRFDLQLDSVYSIIALAKAKIKASLENETEIRRQQIDTINKVIMKFGFDDVSSNELLNKNMMDIIKSDYDLIVSKSKIDLIETILEKEVKLIFEKKKREAATEITLARDKYIVKYYNWIGLDFAYAPTFYNTFDPTATLGNFEEKVFSGFNGILRYNFMTISDRDWWRNHYFSVYGKVSRTNNISSLKQYDVSVPYIGQTVAGDTNSVDTLSIYTNKNKAYSNAEFKELGTITMGIDYIMFLIKDRSIGFNLFSTMDYVFSAQTLRSSGSLFDQKFRWNLGGGFVFSIPKKDKKTAVNLGVYVLVNDITGPKTPETPNTQTLTIGLKAALPFLMLK